MSDLYPSGFGLIPIQGSTAYSNGAHLPAALFLVYQGKELGIVDEKAKDLGYPEIEADDLKRIKNAIKAYREA